MSLTTWKTEFYPISSSENKEKPDIEKIKAEILLWSGLKPDNLKKHKCEFKSLAVYGYSDIFKENRYILISGHLSPLCKKYAYDITVSDKKECEQCPVYKDLGGVTCDGRNKPYSSFAETGDYQPMLEELIKLLAKLEQDEKEKPAKVSDSGMGVGNQEVSSHLS